VGREVARGGLNRRQEDAGALDIECAGGDAGGDLVERELDGGSVLEDGDGEGGALGMDVEPGEGAAGGVVVEAEGFAAEGGRAAALAGGADVAAEEALAAVFEDRREGWFGGRFGRGCGWFEIGL